MLLYVYSACVPDIKTFEILLRTYEVREVKMDYSQGDEAKPGSILPCKRPQRAIEGGNEQDKLSSQTVMARPCSEAKGHTGYLTFARLKCLSRCG